MNLCIRSTFIYHFFLVIRFLVFMNSFYLFINVDFKALFSLLPFQYIGAFIAPYVCLGTSEFWLPWLGFAFFKVRGPILISFVNFPAKHNAWLIGGIKIKVEGNESSPNRDKWNNLFVFIALSEKEGNSLIYITGVCILRINIQC